MAPRSGRPRRGYVWTTAGQKVAEGQITEWLSEYVTGEGSAYGYRKLTVWLRRTHALHINKKTVYRLMREAGLLQGRSWPQRGTPIPRHLARNHTVTAPNQLWEMDLKYGYVAGTDRFFYLCSVIDVYDRSLLAYHLGWTCLATEAAQALRQAVARRRSEWGETPPTIRTDNGPQFTALKWAEACTALQLPHERIPNATPNKNAHIESWHASLERECLANQEFATYAEAYRTVTTWIAFYNERRMHGSLDDWPPAVFYARWRAGTAPQIDPVAC